MITVTSLKRKSTYHQTKKKEYVIVFDKCVVNYGSYYCYLLFNDKIILDTEFILDRVSVYCATSSDYEEMTKNGINTYKFYIKDALVVINLMRIPQEDPVLFVEVLD
jgi:hypothetical protein